MYKRQTSILVCAKASSIGINTVEYLLIPHLSPSAPFTHCPSAIPISSIVWWSSTYVSPVSYTHLMEYTDANTTSLIFFFKPIIAPILAFIVLKEVIPVNMIIGILFILTGSIYTILCTMKLQHNMDHQIA